MRLAELRRGADSGVKPHETPLPSSSLGAGGQHWGWPVWWQIERQCTFEQFSLTACGRKSSTRSSLITPSPQQEEIKAAEARGEKMATVSQDVRLDNRFLDLRTPANQAIFKCQSAVCQVRLRGGILAGWSAGNKPKCRSVGGRVRGFGLQGGSSSDWISFGRSASSNAPP